MEESAPDVNLARCNNFNVTEIPTGQKRNSRILPVILVFTLLESAAASKHPISTAEPLGTKESHAI